MHCNNRAATPHRLAHCRRLLPINLIKIAQRLPLCLALTTLILNTQTMHLKRVLTNDMYEGDYLN